MVLRAFLSLYLCMYVYVCLYVPLCVTLEAMIIFLGLVIRCGKKVLLPSCGSQPLLAVTHLSLLDKKHKFEPLKSPLFLRSKILFEKQDKSIYLRMCMSMCTRVCLWV